MDLLSNIFDQNGVQIISQVKTVHSHQPDTLRWTLAKRDGCTTKNIYRHLSTQLQVQLPQQGPRSIIPQADRILQRMWKLRVPPLIKMFTWRLIRRALETGDRAVD
jgi:hypothetical protein